MHRSICALLLGVLVSLTARSASADCVLQKFAELPVTMAGGRAMVPAKINGADVRFIADSGAFYSVITAEAASALKLRLDPAPPYLMIEGFGGLVRPSVTTVKTFTLLNTDIPDVQFMVTGEGDGAVGLLGQNVLRLGDAEYDLAGGAIRLIRPKGCGDAPLAYWSGGDGFMQMDIQPTSDTTPNTIGDVYINGVRVRAMFDTGATSMISVGAAARAGVKVGDLGVAADGLAAGFGRRPFKVWIGRFTSIKIGDEEISNSRLAIADGDFAGFDMLIGIDFFLSHRVYVSNAQHKLYFTYNGGPIFDRSDQTLRQDTPGQAPVTSVPTDEAQLDPTTAEGFSRRGAAFAARGEFDKAIADFNRASDMAPANADYVYQRAMARLSDKQTRLAMTDLDQTLKLKPDDLDALTVRAQLRLANKDKAGAASDLDAVASLAPKDAERRFGLAELYVRADLLEKAVGQYDLWIAGHPDSGSMASALNGRCWARALAGRDLDQALDDCNRALGISPKTAEILDSRGLVRLRRGELDKAVADYDAALAVRPGVAWSLYGRGLAEARQGDKTKGAADIAAAVALEPGLPDEAKSYGISQTP